MNKGLPSTDPLHVVQVAYHVPDLAEAANRFASDFGWGPFIVLDRIPVECTYRGKPTEFVHSAAYGQAGPVMAELIVQHDDRPSAIRDVYRASEFGVHHQAVFARDYRLELQRFADMGYPTAMTFRSLTGVEAAFVDTRSVLGMMLEVYAPAAALRDFYAMVREASVNWDGKDPIRRPGFRELTG